MAATHALAETVDLMGVTETWLTRDDQDIKNMMDETTEAPPIPRLQRGTGAVGIILKPYIQYKLLHREATDKWQFLTIRIRDWAITVLYASPRATHADLELTLTEINAVLHGKGVMLRDFNARHRHWDRISTKKANTLIRWGNEYGWIIQVPPHPTCYTSMGRSTVDLTERKEISTKTPTELEAPTPFASEHIPITALLGSHNHRTETVRRERTSMAQRSDHASTTELAKWMDTNAKPILHLFTETTTDKQLHKNRESIATTVLRVWRNNLTPIAVENTQQAQTEQLQYLMRRRKILYRSAVTTNKMLPEGNT